MKQQRASLTFFFSTDCRVDIIPGITVLSASSMNRKENYRNEIMVYLT